MAMDASCVMAKGRILSCRITSQCFPVRPEGRRGESVGDATLAPILCVMQRSWWARQPRLSATHASYSGCRGAQAVRSSSRQMVSLSCCTNTECLATNAEGLVDGSSLWRGGV